jgi:hypothetical protein
VLIRGGLYRLTVVVRDEFRYLPVLAPSSDSAGRRAQVAITSPEARAALQDVTEVALVPGLQLRTHGDTILVSLAEIATVRRIVPNEGFYVGLGFIGLAVLGMIGLSLIRLPNPLEILK